LPEKFVDVRNLFQVLLAEAFFTLTQVKERALAMDALKAETRKELTTYELPFDLLCLTLKYTKECLADVHLLGKVKNQAKLV
jgi:hypothetical protein